MMTGTGERKKRIAILGSTGSIGTQALEVIQQNSAMFEVEVLAANNNVELLTRQAALFVPNAVVIANEAKYEELRDALSGFPIKVYAGCDAMEQVVEMESIDVVLTALVGYAGLLPTIRAIEAGKHIALANKETLVVAGQLIKKLALENRVSILPVDSEHSAIFQCLAGEDYRTIEKIILTASGGPFRKKTLDEMRRATRREALNHPNWCMGDKITIDSASLMNKGLEAIEAKWLFDLSPAQIEIVIHPQSIVHSMVQFNDGSIKAQMGLPDMRLPIHYALAFPQRIKADFPRFNFADYPVLNFDKPDFEKFRNLGLAYEAMIKGGNMPCIMNAANEIAVDSFLSNNTGFLEMTDIIEQTMQAATFIKNPALDDFKDTDLEARKIASGLIK